MTSGVSVDMPGETPSVNLTLRMLMSGKEVGPIIGKGGEIINAIREEAGAKIHISDGSCPERVITVTGPTDTIFKAYSLICKKLEDEDLARLERRSGEREEEGRKEGLSLRLVIPASQCGSLIGKGGSKIKEIREVTGCSVQVASDPLPASTERMVTVAGSKDAVTQCIYHICCVMLESPAKGTTVQYQPGRAGYGPGPMMHRGERGGGPGGNPLASLLGLGGDGGSTLAAIASIAGSQIRRHEMRNREERGVTMPLEREASFQMAVPNELIGSVIGKGGSKIAEIRQMSGAMIRISRSDDPATAAEEERQINITGNPDSVALAKSLINMSLDLHKASLERGESQEDEREDNMERKRDRRDDRDDNRGHRGYRDQGMGTNLASLLSKPDVLAAVTLIGQLSHGGGGGGGNGMGFGQMSGMGPPRPPRAMYPGSRGPRPEEERRDNKRSKFAPY